MKLFDVIFGQGDCGKAFEDQLHSLGISSDFLLIPRCKGLDFQVRKQALHLAIGKLRPFDTRGRSGAFDRGDMAKCGQAVGRKPSQSAPGSLEFVQLGNERQYLACDFEGRRVEADIQCFIHFHPIRRVERAEFIQLYIQYHPIV